MKKQSTFATKRKKRPGRLPIIITALVAIGLTMAAAFGTEGDTFTVSYTDYTLTFEVTDEPTDGNSGTAELIQYTPATDSIYSCAVPDTVQREITDESGTVTETYTVTAIGNRLDGLDTIGAFEGANKLVSLTLPSTLKEIKSNAFKGCTILSSLNNDVAKNTDLVIAEGAFDKCYYLSKYYLPLDENRNPNPFGNDEISDFSFEYRGGTGYIIPADIPYTTSMRNHPVRLFKNDVQTFSLSIVDNYVNDSANVALMQMPSLEAVIALDAASYEIDTTVFSETAILSDIYTFTLDGSNECNKQWEENPVIFMVHAETNKFESTPAPAPTVLIDDEICVPADKEFSFDVETANATSVGYWTLNGLTPTYKGKNETNGNAIYTLSGTLSEGIYECVTRIGSNSSSHDKTFFIYAIAGADSEADEPEPPVSSATKLSSPQNCKWDTATGSINATWDSVENATGYTLQLYKDNEISGNPVSVNSGLINKYDFSDAVLGAGTYHFTVTATSTDSNYSNSEPGKSDNYTVQNLPAPQNCKWDTSSYSGKIMATWDAVENAGSYNVHLYKNNEYKTTVSVNASSINNCDFTDEITTTYGEGTYIFKVTTMSPANSNGLSVTGGTGTSDEYTYPPEAQTTKLPDPQNCLWDTTQAPDKILATWTKDENADHYIIVLYKDEQKSDEIYRGKALSPEIDFTERIREYGTGTYYFTVTAKGDNISYSHSNTVKSDTYTYLPASSEAKQYTITATAGEGGSISPAGVTTVKEGGNQEYTITVNEGYEIASVIIDGANQGKITSYAFENITADHEIKVEFAPVSNKIEGVADSYAKGTDIIFTAVGHGADNTSPATGDTRWLPATWRLDSIALQKFEDNNYTDSISTKHLTKGTHTLRVKFVKQKFNGTEWVNVEGAEPDTKEITFEVTAADANGTGGNNSDGTSGDSNGTGSSGTDSGASSDGSSSDSDNNSSGNSSSGNSDADGSSDSSSAGSSLSDVTDTVKSYFTNPQTGDILPARVLFAGGIALAMLVIFGLVATMPKPARKHR